MFESVFCGILIHCTVLRRPLMYESDPSDATAILTLGIVQNANMLLKRLCCKFLLMIITEGVCSSNLQPLIQILQPNRGGECESLSKAL